MYFAQDTIAAIATAVGGAVAMIRVSGCDCSNVIQTVCRPVSSEKELFLEGYRAHLCRMVDKDGEIDEGIVLYYKGPKSYTGEDAAELFCHGSPFVAHRLLAAVLTAGARIAQPGEFTKRAFLNGRMSLTQAEAVADLVAAGSDRAAQAAHDALEGALYREMCGCIDRLKNLLAHVAAWIDFPEEDVEALLPEEILSQTQLCLEVLDGLLSRYKTVMLCKNGVRTAILGRPNVGKSTLLNLLSEEEKSIVSDIPGTTRDIVAGGMLVAGVRLDLYDTAGIRQTTDPIEKIGVERARTEMERADLCLCIFDGAQPLNDDDFALMDAVADRPAIAVINKMDLDLKLDRKPIEAAFSHVVDLSARTGEGRRELDRAVEDILSLSQLQPGGAQLANLRHRDCARRAADALREAQSALRTGMTLDGVEIHLEDALNALLSLTGEAASEEIIDAVFEKFCVGK